MRTIFQTDRFLTKFKKEEDILRERNDKIVGTSKILGFETFIFQPQNCEEKTADGEKRLPAVPSSYRASELSKKPTLFSETTLSHSSAERCRKNCNITKTKGFPTNFHGHAHDQLNKRKTPNSLGIIKWMRVPGIMILKKNESLSHGNLKRRSRETVPITNSRRNKSI
ncbi:unnamed protein product [Calicophoron daubneyi]|uniref:Uncharacterized protein n=1 Tax=Calicophoron daubneyi TaxID=300641 RepID=A0AAV2TWV9_CALDB